MRESLWAADTSYHSQPGRPDLEAVGLGTKGLELGKKKELGTLEDTGRDWTGNSLRNQGPGSRNSSIGRMLAQNLQSPMLYLRINRVWWQEDQEFKIRLSFIRSSRPV